MPKMHQNTFGSRALTGPTGGALALPPDLLAAIKGFLLLRRGRGRGREGGKEEGRV